MRRIMAGLLPLLLAFLTPLTAGYALACDEIPDVWGGFVIPPRVVGALARGDDLRIVALGSSSTEGYGATAPDRSYPAQLESLLRDRFPDREVTVRNRGVSGENAADTLARIDRDVLCEACQLVIWQVGTNDALQDRDGSQVASEVERGIERIRAGGADVVLMDSQPLPDPAAERSIERIDAAIEQTAFRTGTPVLQRHALMLHWLATGAFTFDTMLGPDRLHMTDAAYRCLAVRVADLFPSEGPALVSALDTGP